MGFRINNNITALIAQGNLQKNQKSLTTSIERLSSGLRINRGADDAAGLTISEKLRGQIKGLNRAILNAQDGISLIQTAEGALNEDATILNRIRELTIQASSDTLTTNDRLEIQKEVDQLVSEVDRIANTTEFNTKKLLDGTATAIVSVNEEGLQGIQVGSTRQSSGDYNVEINLATQGDRQQQASNILINATDKSLASLDSKLGQLDSFIDNEGNNILDTPIELTIRGNTNTAKITLSSDVSVKEFVSLLKSTITGEVGKGGLGIRGTDVSFDKKTGQVLITSGKEGSTGDIFFASDENLIKAFGFQETVPSKDPAYRASAIQQNVSEPIQKEASTTTNRFRGIIPGVDLQFDPPTSARVEGTEAPIDVITIGDSDLSFEFTDTNSDITEATPSDIVRVLLRKNTTYSMVSIENIINNNIKTGTDQITAGRYYDGADNVWSPPNVRATFQGGNLILTSGLSGSSSKISIFNATSSATNILGIQNGVYTGNQGETARISGTKNLSTGFSVGPAGLAFEIVGPDGRTTGTAITPTGRIQFSPGVNVSATSLIQTINNQLRSTNIRAVASLDPNGQLILESTEDGEDTTITIRGLTGNVTDVGLVNGVSGSGRGGIPAAFKGNSNPSFIDVGYTFDTTVRIEITDQYGATSGDIVFAASIGPGGVQVATANNVTLSNSSISALLNQSGLSTTDITYDFDAGGRLFFRSKSVGDNARILLTSKDPRFGVGVEPATFTAATTQTTLQSTMGIDGTQVAQGTGKTKYAVHISDRSFSLQIGANENQTLESSIANFNANALGIKGLDVTSFPAAVKALGSVDHAVNTVSSERSKLGSLQNRLTSTINNLTVTSNNLQAAESRIRDVDIAQETVEFTRNQILIQAGTAQLAQANALPQQALQLLGS